MALFMRLGGLVFRKPNHKEPYYLGTKGVSWLTNALKWGRFFVGCAIREIANSGFLSTTCAQEPQSSRRLQNQSARYRPSRRPCLSLSAQLPRTPPFSPRVCHEGSAKVP